MLRLIVFIIFGIITLITVAPSVSALTIEQEKPVMEESEKDNEATIAAEIEYDLAYPGILPDHPLFKLKVVRNKLQEFLTSSPIGKVEYYSLQADKGMFATLLLSEKDKNDLTAETALKAEHNMTMVNTYLKKMNEKPEQDLLDKLKLASLKHQEALMAAREHLSGQNQDTIDTVISFSNMNLDELKRYESIAPDQWNIDK